MGFFKTKEEKAAIQAEKQRKKEKTALFMGVSLQPIGKIAVNQIPSLSLDPDNQLLYIKYGKDVKISLPYDRIVSFSLQSETEIMNGGNAGLRALAGGVLFGAAGATVGAASAKNKPKKKWVGTLTYKDKSGEIASLSFLEYNLLRLHEYEGDSKSLSGLDFENLVNGIASRFSKDIIEL